MATAPRSRNTLTLYSAKNCVVCHKVRMVMAAKGLTYDLVPVDTANPPEDLLLLAPHYHSVPTLVERDNAIYISNVIAEYLDERYPHPALMPAEPFDRFRRELAGLVEPASCGSWLTKSAMLFDGEPPSISVSLSTCMRRTVLPVSAERRSS